MSSLIGGLNIALNSLLVQQSAMQATTDNISNVNTPGYARRRPVLRELPPSSEGSVLVGRGIELASIESVRDRVLDLRISREQQQQSASDAFIASLSAIELSFDDSDQSLGGKIQAFFSSVTKLSTEPTNMTLRRTFLNAADEVARAFRDISQKIHSEQSNIDTSIQQSVKEVNRITSEIASLNVQVRGCETLGKDAGPLEDQRMNLIGELSKLVDVSAIESETGVSLVMSNGSPLVVGEHQYELETAPDSAGAQQLVLQGSVVTDAVGGGKLGGLLSSRDDALHDLSTHLDQFATEFAAAVNTVHRAGTDDDGHSGSDIFTIANGSGSMQCVLSDPRLVAASNNGTPAGNGNLLQLSALRDTALASGETPLSGYSSLVFTVGAALADAKADNAAGDLVLRQLEAQRGAVSGVSLDEEATNLVRFQRAYEASARVISTIDQMLQTAVNLGRE